MSTCFVKLKTFVIKLLKIKQILFANVFKKLLLLVKVVVKLFDKNFMIEIKFCFCITIKTID